MSKIAAVLFDMDGVLIDARDWHYEALNDALAPFGMSISRDAHLSTFDGLSTRQKLKILSEARGLPLGLLEFVNALKQRHTKVKIAAQCRPVFHHRYLLGRLRQEGYRLALCSNSIRDTIEAMIDLAAIGSFFEVTLSNEDVTQPKPAPDIYQEAIRRMGLTPNDCLVVEDNMNGIAAARAAGVHVLEVAHPGDVTYQRVMDEILRIERDRR